jgi:hypothetical protein
MQQDYRIGLIKRGLIFVPEIKPKSSNLRFKLLLQFNVQILALKLTGKLSKEMFPI